jgi:hypothetical protein
LTCCRSNKYFDVIPEDFLCSSTGNWYFPVLELAVPVVLDNSNVGLDDVVLAKARTNDDVVVVTNFLSKQLFSSSIDKITAIKNIPQLIYSFIE